MKYLLPYPLWEKIKFFICENRGLLSLKIRSNVTKVILNVSLLLEYYATRFKA